MCHLGNQSKYQIEHKKMASLSIFEFYTSELLVLIMSGWGTVLGGRGGGGEGEKEGKKEKI